MITPDALTDEMIRLWWTRHAAGRSFETVLAASSTIRAELTGYPSPSMDAQEGARLLICHDLNHAK